MAKRVRESEEPTWLDQLYQQLATASPAQANFDKLFDQFRQAVDATKLESLWQADVLQRMIVKYSAVEKQAFTLTSSILIEILEPGLNILYSFCNNLLKSVHETYCQLLRDNFKVTQADNVDDVLRLITINKTRHQMRECLALQLIVFNPQLTIDQLWLEVRRDICQQIPRIILRYYLFYYRDLIRDYLKNNFTLPKASQEID